MAIHEISIKGGVVFFAVFGGVEGERRTGGLCAKVAE